MSVTFIMIGLTNASGLKHLVTVCLDHCSIEVITVLASHICHDILELQCPLILPDFWDLEQICAGCHFEFVAMAPEQETKHTHACTTHHTQMTRKQMQVHAH